MLATLPYHNKTRAYVDDHSTDDIINALAAGDRVNAKDYDKIAPHFWRGSDYATAKFLYDFLKKEIRYDIEPDELQTVKTPGAILAQKKGDCKHYASFVCGIFSALKRAGYPVSRCIYRFANYSSGMPDVHHVFAVVLSRNGEIWVDPVLPTFNNKKSYKYNKDMVAFVSGVDGIFDDVKKGIKNTGKKLQKAGQDVKKTFLKVNPLSVAGRNAFLALLKLNVFNMAVRIYTYAYRNAGTRAEWESRWKSLGGDAKAFWIAVNTGFDGYARRRKINIPEYRKSRGLTVSGILIVIPNAFSDQVYCRRYSDDGNKKAVGLEPATTTALIAAAAGVIAALVPLLRKSGWSGRDEKEAVDATDAGLSEIEEKVKYVNDGSVVVATDREGRPIITAKVTTLPDGRRVVEPNTGAEGDVVDDRAAVPWHEALWRDNKPLILGGAALAVYLLANQKKR